MIIEEKNKYLDTVILNLKFIVNICDIFVVNYNIPGIYLLRKTVMFLTFQIHYLHLTVIYSINKLKMHCIKILLFIMNII